MVCLLCYKTVVLADLTHLGRRSVKRVPVLFLGFFYLRAWQLAFLGAVPGRTEYHWCDLSFGGGSLMGMLPWRLAVFDRLSIILLLLGIRCSYFWSWVFAARAEKCLFLVFVCPGYKIRVGAFLVCFVFCAAISYPTTKGGSVVGWKSLVVDSGTILVAKGTDPIR